MKAARNNKPSPPNVFGGKGWVRGLSQVVLQRRPVLMRLPLTPALLAHPAFAIPVRTSVYDRSPARGSAARNPGEPPDDEAVGGEGVFLLASEDCSQ